MKKLLCLFILTFNMASLYANAIDQLKTTADVIKFLYNLDEKLFKQNNELIKFLPVDSIIRNPSFSKLDQSWKVRSWQKVDFNQDGHTDLLIQPHWPYITTAVIMDNGNNTFKVSPLSNFELTYNEVASPLKLNGKQLLLFRHNKNATRISINPKIDTLIFKYGSFVEYHERYSTTELSSVSLETNMCYGVCPVFRIDVYSNGKAMYNARKFNPTQGSFSGTIDENNLKELIDLIKYIDVKTLNNKYSVGWTDDQTAFLTVTFSDGTSKQITDYGLRGTFGLKRLYELLTELRISQAWYKQ